MKPQLVPTCRRALFFLLAPALFIIGCSDFDPSLTENETNGAVERPLAKTTVNLFQMMRVVQTNTPLIDDTWVGGQVEVLFRHPTGPLTVPDACGTLSNQFLAGGSNGIAFDKRKSGLVETKPTEVHKDIALFTELPLPRGSRLTNMISDTQDCCTDANGDLTACNGPSAANSFRLMVGTLEIPSMEVAGATFRRVVPAGQSPHDSDLSNTGSTLVIQGEIGGGEYDAVLTPGGNGSSIDLVARLITLPGLCESTFLCNNTTLGNGTNFTDWISDDVVGCEDAAGDTVPCTDATAAFTVREMVGAAYLH